MKKAQVDVLISIFSYGGNGGLSMILPQLAIWLALQHYKMKQDERVGRIGFLPLSDTPITMTRNRAVRAAIDGGFDMLLMLDSDNEPDGYVGRDHDAKPFWDVAFEHAYGRLLQGKPTVIAAPYCGPPPRAVPRGIDYGEVPYLFHWVNNESDVYNPGKRLEIMNRNEASKLRGIVRVAALPTGVSLWTTNVFEGMPRPIFDYEFSDDGSEKETTEDVFATRNASLFWAAKIRENVLFAACDSWALHHKPKQVGRPTETTIEFIAQNFSEAILAQRSSLEQIRDLDLPDLDEEDVTTADQVAAATDTAWAEYSMGAPQHREALARLVTLKSQELSRPLRVVEVGSWLGGSAIAMADTGCVEKLICVDTWKGAPAGDNMRELVSAAGGPDAVYQEFRRRIGPRLGNPIVPIRGQSVHVAHLISENADGTPSLGRFDLIFLDGDHTKAGLLADIEAWWPHLADGGILCGHDYRAKGFPGVTLAVEQAFGDDVDCVGYTNEDEGGLFVVRKEAARQAIDACEHEGPEPEEAVAEAASNGRHSKPAALRHKRVCGRKVALLGYEVSDTDLEILNNVTRWLVGTRDGGALEACVLHCGSGQATAAVVAALPPGSHCHCLDALALDPQGDLLAAEFGRAFEAELVTARVQADLLGRMLPSVGAGTYFDLVVVERFAGIKLLNQWLDHVAPNGLLAGLGFDEPRVADSVRTFAAGWGLELKVHEGSGLWAIPVVSQPSDDNAAESLLESDE